MALIAEERSPRRAPRSAPRPALTVLVSPVRSRSLVPFAAVITAIVLATLGLVLALNIGLSHGAYELNTLNGQSRELEQQKQELAEKNEELGTPQSLEAQARKLGMVPAGEVAYIDLRTGEVTGDAVAAGTEPDQESSIPPASIYSSDDTYVGLGNEGR